MELVVAALLPRGGVVILCLPPPEDSLDLLHWMIGLLLIRGGPPLMATGLLLIVVGGLEMVTLLHIPVGMEREAGFLLNNIITCAEIILKKRTLEGTGT